MTEELIEKLKSLLATKYAFYVKVQNFHWNVEGPNFAQYHTYFEDLYKEIRKSIDVTAEQIRALGSYTPGSFVRFQELSLIKDETNIPTAIEMFKRLTQDNEVILTLLKEINGISQDEPGIQNFIQERIDVHNKHRWMLKSFSKI